MSPFEAFILGLVQAVTEFFPVSSSAHLKLVKIAFGMEEGESTVLLDLCCHGATLFAVLFFLRKEIQRIFTIERDKLLLLFLATLPLVPCYFLLKPLREFASKRESLGFCLMLTGVILLAGQLLRLKWGSRSKIKDALWIGAAQSAALIPGISRSASTISCARALGWKIEEAVRFSFLLSIPTIIGGNTVELARQAIKGDGSLHFSWQNGLIAFGTALCASLLIIKPAMRILERGSYIPFAIYCMALGGVVFYCFNV